jgi:ubiquinol-cytochrome c reductase iron-sulfur subunit
MRYRLCRSQEQVAELSQSQDTAIVTRRDFVAQAGLAFLGTGSLVAMWPLIAQMASNAATPLPETVDVDLRSIAPGNMKLVRWRGAPYFVRHRTLAEVREARATALVNLPDRLARNVMLPDTAPAIDSNRTKEGHEKWLVVSGTCTHMGCVLSGQTDTSGEVWFCRCHAARFDASGRVRAGPARTNLPVPRYQFLSDSKIQIGKSAALNSSQTP